MSRKSAEKMLDLAREHLKRVQAAWDKPTDWAGLSMYGFYCLEAAVMAAAEHLNWRFRRGHREKADAAEKLQKDHDLPDIVDLMVELNSARKSMAYGDVDFPDLDAEEVALKVEEYVDAVEEFIRKPK
jgi:hypothetical protein